MKFSFSISSKLAVSTPVLWHDVTRMAGVNYELQPMALMTYPAAYKQNSIEQAPLNKVLFNSIILMFGFIPVDVHSLSFEKIQPGVYFQEHSNSWLHHHWKHRRVLEETDEGTIITDYVWFIPRLQFAANFMGGIVKKVFTNRHNRLRAKYGQA